MPRTSTRKPGRPPATGAGDTRDRIVRAARAVFSERGYSGATFQQIADRADLTRPAINHYFSGKRALYREVMERSNEIFVTTASMDEARRETTLLGRLTVFITHAMRSNRDYPGVSAFLITTVVEARRHPDLRGTEQDALRLRREFLTWAVTEAIEHGELAPDIDVGTVVEAIFSVLWGVALYAGYMQSPDALEAITGTLRQLLAGALGIPG